MLTSKRAFQLITVTMSISCAYATDDDVDVAEDGENDAVLNEGRADVAGISEVSADALGVLRVANQLSFADLRQRVRLAARAARGIIAFRIGSDGLLGTSDDRAFLTLRQLDAVPYVGPAAFRRLLAYARANGFVALPDAGTAADAGSTADAGSADAGIAPPPVPPGPLAAPRCQNAAIVDEVYKPHREIIDAQLVVDPQGEAYVTWTDNLALYYARKPVNAGWTAPTLIVSRPFSELVTDSSGFAERRTSEKPVGLLARHPAGGAFFTSVETGLAPTQTGGTKPHTTLRAAHLSPNGWTWQTIAAKPFRMSTLATAFTGAGDVHAITMGWEPQGIVYYDDSWTSAQGWRRSAPVATGISAAGRGFAMNTSGAAVFAWAGEYDKIWAQTHRPGFGWSSPVDLGNGAGPDAAIDAAGNIVVTWTSGSTLAARRAPATGAWHPIEVVPTGSRLPGGSRKVAIAGDQSVILLFECMFQPPPMTDTVSQLCAARFTAANGWTFHVATDIKGNSWQVVAIDIGFNESGEATVAWRSLDESLAFQSYAQRAWAMRYSPSAGFSPITQVSSDFTKDRGISAPKVAIDNARRATIVWRDTKAGYDGAIRLLAATCD
ncbi:MAG: hypothetical protein HYY84_08920 [Deltaproteobacteria bacterium]|nr:hypothetical protein [Deltaproteobacteria bacterium]